MTSCSRKEKGKQEYFFLEQYVTAASSIWPKWGLSTRPNTTLLMAQAEPREEQDTLQNTGYSLITQYLLRTYEQTHFTKNIPFLSFKIKTRQDSPGFKLLTKPVCSSALVPFGYTVLPQNAVQMHFCRIRAQQEGAKIRRVEGQESETRLEWWVRLQVQSQSPVWGLFTPVYRTCVWGWSLQMWGKIMVTTNITLLLSSSSAIWQQASRDARTGQAADINHKLQHLILKLQQRNYLYCLY